MKYLIVSILDGKPFSFKNRNNDLNAFLNMLS